GRGSGAADTSRVVSSSGFTSSIDYTGGRAGGPPWRRGARAVKPVERKSGLFGGRDAEGAHLERSDLVANLGRTLEFELLRRLAHLLTEVGDAARGPRRAGRLPFAASRAPAR